MTNRLTKLAENVSRVADARSLTTTTVWPDTWNQIEQELLERLLKCGPTDDEARYRLTQAIEVARRLRRAIESIAGEPGKLGAQLDQIEGRKMPANA